MPAKDKKKHKNYYYHAKCKQYQKEREAVWELKTASGIESGGGATTHQCQQVKHVQ